MPAAKITQSEADVDVKYEFEIDFQAAAVLWPQLCSTPITMHDHLQCWLKPAIATVGVIESHDVGVITFAKRAYCHCH
jgi:hypothetical protein